MQTTATAAAIPSGITLATSTPTGQTIPVAIGTRCFALGGTLGAIIARPDGTNYGLIVADAEHETTGEWGNYAQDVTGAGNTDGMAATEAMAAAGSAIAKAARALTVGGHTDWRIPTRLELLSLYIHAPKGLFSEDNYYWSCSQYSRYYAFCQGFEYGGSTALIKGNEFRARPVRSIQLQPFNTSTLPTPIAEGDSREILGNEVAA